MFKISTELSDDKQYIGKVTKSERDISYSTQRYPSEQQAIDDARYWIDWFQKVPLGEAESVYYILSVPET